MSERALISFERPIETFHGARAEEEDRKAVEAVVAQKADGGGGGGGQD